MSRRLLGLLLLAASLAGFTGCTALAQLRADFTARMAAGQGVELPWECGEPPADASAHDDLGQSSSEGGPSSQ
jgi:hypothetical protein